MTKNNVNIGIIFLLIGLFVFPYYIREAVVVGVFHSTKMFFWSVSFFSILGCLFLVWENGRYESIRDLRWIVLWVIPVISMLVSTWEVYSDSIPNWVFSAFMLVCTAYISILMIFIRSVRISEGMIRAIFLFLNILMILLALASLIDLFYDRFLIRTLARMTGYVSIFYWHAINPGDWTRFCSYIGHPLINVALANMVYALNVVADKKKIKGAFPVWLSAIISAILVATCSSKTGAAVFLGITVLAALHNKKMALLSGAGLVVAFVARVFNKLIDRIASTSLTTGRFEGMALLWTNQDYPFHLFKGYGVLTELYEVFGAPTFEFPFVNLTYRYGLIYPIIFLGLPLIYCLVWFFRKREYLALMLWLGLFAEMNTFDSLGCTALDYDFIFWFFTFLLMQLSLGRNLSEQVKNVDGMRS